MESADAGVVAGVSHPKSNCRARDDVTANARIYNEIDMVPIKDFRPVEGSQDEVVWVKQTGDKRWDNNDREGEWECAAPPMAVSNRETYYYYDGNVWSGHPGWWGHQEDYEWAADPSGYVWWTCTGAPVNGWGNPCPDSALSSATVKAPWDARDSDGNSLTRQVSCEVGGNSRVVGCYTSSYHNSGHDWDFVFDTYAWTAPMRLDLSTSWTVLDQAFVPVSPGESKEKLTDIYLAWKVNEATLTQGAEWVNRMSPQGQIVKAGASNGLSVGAYAIADNTKSTMALKLSPAYFTTKDGAALSCSRDASKLKCSYVKDGDTPPSVGDFFEKAFSINVTASLELQDVKRDGGPPKIKIDKDGKTKADPISCKKSAQTLGNANVVLTCEKAGGEAGSAFAYGASWLAAISRT